MSKSGNRRSQVDTLAICEKIDAAVAGGSTIAEALEKFDVAGSVYGRYRRNRKAGGSTGAMNISALPPRPKANGKHGGKRKMDMTSVAGLAKRISALDRKLALFASITEERKALAGHLLKLLKP